MFYKLFPSKEDGPTRRRWQNKIDHQCKVLVCPSLGPRKEKKKKGENVYIACICGVVRRKSGPKKATKRGEKNFTTTNYKIVSKGLSSLGMPSKFPALTSDWNIGLFPIFQTMPSARCSLFGVSITKFGSALW